MAITETHLGGSPDEQLRWLAELWNTAVRLRSDGVALNAVTIWSMFGAVDEDTLLVRRGNSYEAGVFDARFSLPRATPLADAVRGLAANGEFSHEALGLAGWWHRGDRFLGQA